MRILVNDFGGYAFPVQLSRALARRGHAVLHTYCGSHTSTPSGHYGLSEGDPPQLEIRSLQLGKPLDKVFLLHRWMQENEYGRLVAREAARFRPDVVLSANMPLDAQRKLLKACHRGGMPFVFWVQDLIGVATERILRRRLPVVGRPIGGYYMRMEQALARRSDALVLITEDFRPVLQDWGVGPDRVHVIENWAPLGALPVREKDNAWARQHGLADAFCFLYAGTLGMKHNPDLLLELARHVAAAGGQVVVLSQGAGADRLRAQQHRKGVENLTVLPYVQDNIVPDVYGAADVLLAQLEPDAAVFSVPSKVLSYLCAARPLLLAVPPENLAARIVSGSGAGIVVPPEDTAAFLKAADLLMRDAALRERMGHNARAHAEQHFDINRIADAFEAVLQRATGSHPSSEAG